MGLMFNKIWLLGVPKAKHYSNSIYYCKMDVAQHCATKPSLCCRLATNVYNQITKTTLLHMNFYRIISQLFCLFGAFSEFQMGHTVYQIEAKTLRILKNGINFFLNTCNFRIVSQKPKICLHSFTLVTKIPGVGIHDSLLTQFFLGLPI